MCQWGQDQLGNFRGGQRPPARSQAHISISGLGTCTNVASLPAPDKHPMQRGRKGISFTKRNPGSEGKTSGRQRFSL